MKIATLLLFLMTSKSFSSTCDLANLQWIDLGTEQVAKKIPKKNRYTQGLVVHHNELVEGSGHWGFSGIYQLTDNIKEKDGFTQEKQLYKNDSHHFGEGIAVIGDSLFQLTWRSGVAFKYSIGENLSDLKVVDEFRYDGEGWGLASFKDRLIMSDGSSMVRFIDPNDFSEVNSVIVRLGEQEVSNLNELEEVNGQVFANIYGNNVIVGFEPNTGCVKTVIDVTNLVESVDFKEVKKPVCYLKICQQDDFVLNGIAYDEDKKEFYITGKNWPAVYTFADILN